MDGNIKERVLKAVCEINEEIAENSDKDLLETGIIDSFDIVNMMISLEDEFEIDIDAELVIPDNFKTVDAMVEMISQII